MEIIFDNWDKDITLVEKSKRCFHVVKFAKEKEDYYKMTVADININSPLIDKEEVATALGMIHDFSAEEFAAYCLDYYGGLFWNSSAAYYNKKEAETKIDSLLMSTN